MKRAGSGPARRLALVLAGTFAVFSCTDSYLYDERRTDTAPVDRAFALEGKFCTVGSNEVVRPIKILMAMDASQSMKTNDPTGTRADALIDLINKLPYDPEIYIQVMLFAGSTSVCITGTTQTCDFVQLCRPNASGVGCTPWAANEKANLIGRLFQFTQSVAASTNNPNRDSTDFEKALADIYRNLSEDMARSRLNAATTGESPGRYSVIFLSDGHPTINQDAELLCGSAVTRIRDLKDLVEDVRFNTVHVFNPLQPLSTKCDLTTFQGSQVVNQFGCRTIPQVTGNCTLLMASQDAERLRRMAELGGGDFRDFQNGEPVNFLSFRFGQVRRSFVFNELVATNFSAPPGSPIDQADTDGDGLTDLEELAGVASIGPPAGGQPYSILQVNTDPWRKDSDIDGFSDGVESFFAVRGGQFHTNQVGPDGGGTDIGCPGDLRGKDTDCDGLTDCDEQLIGSNAERVDSDDDGVPDGIEWQMGTQPAARDLEQDPDTDGVTNRAEVRMHTLPNDVDTGKLTDNGYRYLLTADGPVDAEGRQCYDFRVDNISLANTRPDLRVDGGTGTPAGFNDLYLSLAMKPGDEPNARTIVRQLRTKVPRFPVGGIKSPVDGVLRVAPEDFQDRCGRSTTGTP